LKLAAVVPSLAERVPVNLTIRVIEDGLARPLGVHQDLRRSQQGFQAFLDAVAELAVSHLERTPRPPAHRRQVLVIHRDCLVQQGFLGFRQKAGDQGVPLGRCEPLEVVRIVTPRQLGQVLYQDRADSAQVNLSDSKGAQPCQPVEMGEDGRGVGFGRVLLELEQFRQTISLRHLDEGIDRAPDLRRQPVGDPLDDFLAAAGRDGGDDRFEGRGRGQDDFPRVEQSFGATEHLGKRVSLLCQGVHRLLKLVLGSLVEGAKPQVISNAVFVLEIGGFPLRRVDEQDWWET
jgi:hypothetical protein